MPKQPYVCQLSPMEMSKGASNHGECNVYQKSPMEEPKGASDTGECDVCQKSPMEEPKGASDTGKRALWNGQKRRVILVKEPSTNARILQGIEEKGGGGVD